MTLTKGAGRAPPSPTTKARRSHVPTTGPPKPRRSSRPARRCSTTPGTEPHADRRRRRLRGAPPPGRRRLLQLSRRRDPAALRRPRRLSGAPPRPRPPRAGRRPRRRRLCPGNRPGRGLHGDVRARRDQPRDRDRHRPARLRPDGRDHRQRALRPDRQGRLPGDRHQRHHPADDEAQLPRPRRRTTCRASSPRPSTSPGRAGPGPVHVDITKDALQQETTRRTRPTTRSSPGCPASARTSTPTAAS